MKKTIIIIFAACLAGLLFIVLYILINCALYGKYQSNGPEWANRSLAFIFLILGIDFILFIIYKKQYWLPELKKIFK